MKLGELKPAVEKTKRTRVGRGMGSGLGKTYFATEWAKELGIECFDIVSFENGFWNGVTDTCSFAFFDEFRDNAIPGVEFVKLIDYTVKNLNIKGGQIKNQEQIKNRTASGAIMYPMVVFDRNNPPSEVYLIHPNPKADTKEWLIYKS